MKHFRQLALVVDPAPLLEQLERNPDLWTGEDAFTRDKAGQGSFYNNENVVLRANELYHSRWSRRAFSILTQAQKIIFDVMHAIPGEHLGRVIISRMHPGESIEWHTDSVPPEQQYWQRYQISLAASPGVRFCVEDEEVYMEPGTAWWFDYQKRHAVFNDSERDRINMFTDIRPFTLHTG